MKRIVLIVIALLLPIFQAGAQNDSTDRYEGFDKLLAEFYTAIAGEETQIKCREMDSLIQTCTDSLTRHHVANQIFDHYRNSRVMGEEAVAIHIFDKWFASEEIKMDGEFSFLDAQIFANFNRNSLIGMQAPIVQLIKPNKKKLSVPQKGRLTVLFFYDTSCSKCRLETKLLPQVLNEVDFELDFCAVNTGDSKKDWRAYRRSLKVKNRKVRLLHLWDPEMDSDYQLLYGVISTPKMYLVLENGEIIGRRLEVENLKQIFAYIEILNGYKEEK